MEYRHELTGEDERFVYGKTYTRGREADAWQFATAFCRYKEDLWFSNRPHEVLAGIGVDTDPRRAREFIDLLDGDLNGFFYLSEAAPVGQGDEALKWVMGSLAALLNERKLPFSRASEVLPADYLRAFVEALVGGKFEKSFAKDVFAEVVAAERYEWDSVGFTLSHLDPVTDLNVDATAFTWEDWVGESETEPFDLFTGEKVSPKRRIPGAEAVAAVISDPRFKAADTSEIDAIIETVIAANPENAAKVADQPKLVQWFTGQVMKAAKGKAPAPVVLEKLKARFGITD